MISHYSITSESQAKTYENHLNSYWVDFHSGLGESQMILNFYLRKDNYKYIDTQKNNQIAFYLGFHAKDSDLISLLINNKDLKNKNYELGPLNKFYPSDEGLRDILFLILDNIKDKKGSSFDLSKIKDKKNFLTNCCEYFVYALENELGDMQGTIKDLFRFIDLSKCQYHKNQYNILHYLLNNEQTDIFSLLFLNLKNNKEKKEMLTSHRNPLAPKYIDEVESFLSKLELNFSLNTSLPNKQKNKTPLKL